MYYWIYYTIQYHTILYYTILYYTTLQYNTRSTQESGEMIRVTELEAEEYNEAV